MKKIAAFILSATMCLSLLTALTPAFAYKQDGEQVAMMRMVDPDDEEEEQISIQGENN